MYVALVAVEKTAFYFDRLFEYILPKDLLLKAKVGSFVAVPFGLANKIRQGVIFKIEKKKKFSV